MRNIRRIRTYLGVAKIGIQSMVEYRVNFLMWILISFVPIIIQYYVWKAIFEKSDSAIKGYTFFSIITYFVISRLVVRLTDKEGIDFNMSSEIRNGDMARYLLKPVNVLRYKIFYFSSKKLLFIFTVMPVYLIICIILLNLLNIKITLISLIYFLLSVFFANLLSLLLGYLMGIFAFWISDNTGIIIVNMFVVNMVSGAVVPIDLYPSYITNIINLLPFKYLAFFPVKILMGEIRGNEFINGLIMLVVWIAIIYAAITICWYKGIKRYSAFGG